MATKIQQPRLFRLQKTLGLALLCISFAQAAPSVLNHQGRISVSNINHDGPGYFKFSLVDSAGTGTYWSNDVTPAGEPATAITLAVSKGHYATLLGATNPIDQALFASHDDLHFQAGKVGVGRLATANALEVEGQASRTTAGSWLANSDRRIRTNIREIDGALEKIQAIRLGDFEYTASYFAAHPAIEQKRFLPVKKRAVRGMVVNPELAFLDLAIAGGLAVDGCLVDIAVVAPAKFPGDEVVEREKATGKMVVPVAHVIADDQSHRKNDWEHRIFLYVLIRPSGELPRSRPYSTAL
ncbi:MAG: tail fiber domain-containing protein [Akkermansiaceae bacterium]